LNERRLNRSTYGLIFIVFAEEDKTLAARVQWYLARALRLDIHAGLRESIQRAVADLQSDGLPD